MDKWLLYIPFQIMVMYTQNFLFSMFSLHIPIRYFLKGIRWVSFSSRIFFFRVYSRITMCCTTSTIHLRILILISFIYMVLVFLFFQFFIAPVAYTFSNWDHIHLIIQIGKIKLIVVYTFQIVVICNLLPVYCGCIYLLKYGHIHLIKFIDFESTRCIYLSNCGHVHPKFSFQCVFVAYTHKAFLKRYSVSEL